MSQLGTDYSRPINALGLGLVLTLIAAPFLGAQTAAEDLKITVGKSIVIDYPTDVARISTSDPAIVDAVAVSTREILLHAKGHGISTVVVWAKTGQRAFYNISVEHNLEPIRRILKDTFPAENIQVQSARDSVSLIGLVSSPEVVDRAGALVASLAKTVVNNLRVPPVPVEKQILLRVKFAEVNRNAAISFGTNLISTGALNTPGSITTGQFGPPSTSELAGTIPGGLQGTDSRFTLTDALNVFAFRPDLNLAATIRALQSQNVLQILAEPNLVTTDGKNASFLVGGEFPIPVLQGGSNAGAVTIQFREFGIRLNFTPKLTPHQTLKMHVRPEVSTIDLANAITFSGFTIPALATRRMDTDIELGPGQSFVIGGLIDDRVTDAFSKIPGLSSIPVLGALFKSKDERKAKTELLVMVTPEIVDPLNPGDPKPSLVMPKEALGPTVPSAKSSSNGARKNPARASRDKKTNEKTAKVDETVLASAVPPALPQQASLRAVAKINLEPSSTPAPTELELAAEPEDAVPSNSKAPALPPAEDPEPVVDTPDSPAEIASPVQPLASSKEPAREDREPTADSPSSPSANGTPGSSVPASAPEADSDAQPKSPDEDGPNQPTEESVKETKPESAEDPVAGPPEENAPHQAETSRKKN